MITTPVTRREFLATGGALIVGVSFGGNGARAQGIRPVKSPTLTDVESFLAIGADGKLTIYSGKVDLGTDVRTALMQIAAEELDLPLERVQVVQGDTLLTPDQGATTSSISISRGGVEIRRAAATARAALIAEAAKLFATPVAQLSTQAGAVHGPDGRQITYERIVSGKQLTMKVDPKIRVKDPSAYRLVGKSIPRVDIPAIVVGTFEYMHDFRLPGMMHARVIRPPTMRGRLSVVDDTEAKKYPAMSPWCANGISLRWWRAMNGRRCARRAPSRRNGRSGKDCPRRPSSRTRCVRRASCVTTSRKIPVTCKTP